MSARPPRRPGLARIGAQLRAVGGLARAAATSPELRKEIGRGLRGRGADAPQPSQADRPAVAPAHPLPAGLTDYAFTAHADTVVAAPVERALALLADPTRFPQWLVMHGGWRDGPPEPPVGPGQTFVQQAAIMGMPVDLRWTVAAIEDTGIELRGVGPMNTMLAFWLTVTTHGDGSWIFFDTGIDGPPLKGPMGATVVRALTEGLTASLAKAAELLGGTAVARSQIRHEASGMLLDPATPVIVGAGQLTQHDPGTADPVALAARALRAAAADSGAGERLLRDADAVYAVSSLSWPYRDQAAPIAAAVGASPSETVQSSPFGGDGSQLLISTAAADIAAGRSQIALVAGAEAGATLAAAQRAGTTLAWPQQDSQIRPARTIGIDRPGNNDAETAAGLAAPIYMYALMESALRARSGHTVEEHQQYIGQLWSRFSTVAAANPFAWQPTEVTAAQLMTVSEHNRLISTPYPKLLCANLQVDLASGLILCSAAAAEAAGIPQGKWIFPHVGASGHDEWFVSERTTLAASPALRALSACALAHTELTIDDIAQIDLYSCFPSAVQIAAAEFGLPVDDPARPLTITGGLTFGGGPGNNYSGHAVATMVARLREHPTDFGLTTALGWYATKHAIGIYSAIPPRQPFAHLQPIIEHPPARPALTGYVGAGVLEAYTVPYDGDGHPEAAILSVITPDGARALARTTSADVIAALGDTDPLGRPVTLAADGVTLEAGEPTPLPSPPPAPVLVERRGSVMVITLNRPHRRNAVDLAMAQALEHAIDLFEDDPAMLVAVLTGAGGSFSSGMDLKAAAGGEIPITDKRGVLGLTTMPPVKPLIAAVEGHALAGGCELALAADLIVAADNSSFGIPEPKRGLVAAAGGVLRLRERLPRNIAMALALTGDPMPATRLAELGLVNEITAPGETLDAALALAERIAANAPISVRASKQIVTESFDWTTAEAFAKQAEIALAAVVSEDAGEGIRAFVDKRAPVWKGR